MNKYAVKKNSINNFLFYFAFILYLFVTIINASFYAKYLPADSIKYTMIFTIVLLIFKELLSKKSKFREWIYLLLILLLTYFVFRNLSGQFAILPLFIFIYSSRDVDLNKIMKIAYYESLSLFLIILVSSKLGIITNYVEYGSRIREYLGFRYSLYGSVLLFNITALDLYIHKEKTGLIRCLIWLLINIIIFKLTDSRLAFYLSILLITFSYIISNFTKAIEKEKIIKLVLCISFIISSVFSIYATYNFNPNISYYDEANEFLGNRLYYGNLAIHEYGINLFGHDLVLKGNGLNIDGSRSTGTYNYVDCLYVMLLLRYGIIFFIIFIGILTATCIYLYRKKQYYLLLLMAILSLHGVIDDLMIYLYYNTFWLIIGKMILNQNKKIEDNK